MCPLPLRGRRPLASTSITHAARTARAAFGAFPVLVAFAMLVLAGTAPLHAQQRQRAVPRDPYTGGESAAMQRAGYVSFGPFPFGHEHGSRDVDALLDEPIAWVETAHFRIGCSAAACSLHGDREWVDRVQAELKQLRTALPTVRAETRELEPWLRAHLIAQRCEALYADVQALLGVDDATFPAGGDDRTGDPRAFRGHGPFLGMPEKFAVLVVQRGANLARYSRRWQGGESLEPVRHHVVGGAMTFAISEQASDGHVRGDLELHALLAYHLAANLYHGYRWYGHDLPAWLWVGLAHRHSRRVTPRFPTYERREGDAEGTEFWQWDKRARGLLRTGAFEPLATLFERSEATTLRLEQHVHAWFVVDWLQATRPAALRQLVHELKDPFHRLERLPDRAELLARQERCVRSAFGTDAGGLDKVWRAESARGRR